MNSISNSGLPLTNNFVPLSSLGGALQREQRVAAQDVSTPVASPQRPEATAADAQGLELASQTRADNTAKGGEDIVAFANAIAAFLDTRVSFTYDDRIEHIVVKVTKGDSEEVIRQIPSEEMIKMVVQLRKDFRGIIFNRTS